MRTRYKSSSTPQLDRFGRLDVLVNNAGITGQVNLVDLDEEEWDRIFDTNVRGMFLCSREAGRHFAEAGAGRAINVASVFGLARPAGFSAYCASKGAVINFTRSVAAEWARFGAQMNAVAPGYFATDINAELREDDAAMAKVLRRIPALPDGHARRAGQPRGLPRAPRRRTSSPDRPSPSTVESRASESSDPYEELLCRSRHLRAGAHAGRSLRRRVQGRARHDARRRRSSRAWSSAPASRPMTSTT